MTNNRHRPHRVFQNLPPRDPRASLHEDHGIGRWVTVGQRKHVYPKHVADIEYPFWRRHSELFGLRRGLMNLKRRLGTSNNQQGQGVPNNTASGTQMQRLIARHGEQLDRGRDYKRRSVWSR